MISSTGRITAGRDSWWGDSTTIARPNRWHDAYLRGVRGSDVFVVVASTIVGQLIRFGSHPLAPVGRLQVPLAAVSIVMIVGWLAVLNIAQTYDRRVIGSGAAEYVRVLRACCAFFGGLAVVDLLFNFSIARGYLAVVFPLGTLGLLMSRRGWRMWLSRSRRRGENLSRLAVVGDMASATPLIERVIRHPDLGYSVAGICLPLHNIDDAPSEIEVDGRSIPVLGGIDGAADMVVSSDIASVAVTSADVLGHRAMRELSWELEDSDTELLLAPALIDVAGPRLTMRPQAGLPLLHVDKPRYQGATKLLKQTFDKVLCLLILLAALPVLVICAVAIKLDNPGPVFYRAERIGVNNQPFRMWKFRSMVVGAHNMRAALASADEGNGVLFKMRDDPRVTRVGAILRRYSLDELPQLFNVLGGTMSLVGPRPPLRQEVETYDHVIVRRMLVRPGMTGLWQVSGRSDLSWEESVRLDLSYVENWTLLGDLMILWRTLRAVVSKSGAY
nr:MULTISPECIES: sugar transferase [Gordonia]